MTKTNIKYHDSKLVILLSALTLALFFSGFLVFLTPLPLVYLVLKLKDYRRVIGPSLILFGLVLLFYQLGLEFINDLYKMHPSLVWLLPIPNATLLEFFPKNTVILFGTGYFAFHLASGLLIGWTLGTPKGFFLKVSVTVGLLLVTAGLVFYAVLGADVVEFFETYRTYMEKGISDLLALQEKAGSDMSALLDMKSRIPELADYTIYLLPAFVLSTLTVLFVINLVLAKRFFRPLFPVLVKIDLTRFQVPFVAVWIAVALISVLLLNVKFLENRALHFLSLNILIVLAEVYFFQGFAVLMWFLEARKIYGIWRLVFYAAVILFLQPTVILLVVLGFFDCWWDVRKLDTGASGSGEADAQA